MIGSAAVAGLRANQPAHLRPVDGREVEVQNHQIRRRVVHRLERGVSAERDVHPRVARPFERVFDELGDVGFVVDNQNPRRWGREWHRPSLPVAHFPPVTRPLNVRYGCDVTLTLQ